MTKGNLLGLRYNSKGKECQPRHKSSDKQVAGWISYSLQQIADILLSVLITAHFHSSHFPEHLKIAIVATH